MSVSLWLYLFIIKLYSRYDINQIFILIKVDIGIFESSMKITGAGPRAKQGQTNRYIDSFPIQTLHAFVFLGT